MPLFARSSAASKAAAFGTTIFSRAGLFARKITGSRFVAKITGKSSKGNITGSPMTAIHDPLSFYCGDTWEIAGTLTDASGAPLDLTGAALQWKLDDPTGAINALTLALGSGITITGLATAGTVLIEPTAVQTAALAAGVYRDQVRVTLADGTVTTQWVGSITALAPLA